MVRRLGSSSTPHYLPSVATAPDLVRRGLHPSVTVLPSNEAFTVLPPLNVNANNVHQPISSSLTRPFRVANQAGIAREKKASFVILAEAPLSGRASPTTLGVNQNSIVPSGRVSPFRGKGFRSPPRSRAASPSPEKPPAPPKTSTTANTTTTTTTNPSKGKHATYNVKKQVPKEKPAAMTNGPKPSRIPRSRPTSPSSPRKESAASPPTTPLRRSDSQTQIPVAVKRRPSITQNDQSPEAPKTPANPVKRFPSRGGVMNKPTTGLQPPQRKTTTGAVVLSPAKLQQAVNKTRSFGMPANRVASPGRRQAKPPVAPASRKTSTVSNRNKALAAAMTAVSSRSSRKPSTGVKAASTATGVNAVSEEVTTIAHVTGEAEHATAAAAARAVQMTSVLRDAVPVPPVDTLVLVTPTMAPPPSSTPVLVDNMAMMPNPTTTSDSSATTPISSAAETNMMTSNTTTTAAGEAKPVTTSPTRSVASTASVASQTSPRPDSGVDVRGTVKGTTIMDATGTAQTTAVRVKGEPELESLSANNLNQSNGWATTNGNGGASNHNGVSDHSSGSGSGTGEGSSPKAVTGVAATLRRAGASVGRCFKCRSCHCPKPGCGNPFRKCCQRNGVRASDLASGTSMVATASAAPTAAQKTTRSLTSSLCCCRRSTSNKPIPAPKITSSGEGRFSKLFGCCRRKPAQRGSTIMVQAPSPGPGAEPARYCGKGCCRLGRCATPRCAAFCLRLACCTTCATGCCCRTCTEPDVAITGADVTGSRKSMARLSRRSQPMSIDVEPKKRLDPALVESTSQMRGAIPILPPCLAWFCLVCNIIAPGLGTILSGVLCLCLGIPRFSAFDTPQGRFGSLIVNTVVGISQAFTVLFCLVGWGWSIWWGTIMIKLARKYKRVLKAEKAQEERQAQMAAAAADHDVERGAT